MQIINLPINEKFKELLIQRGITTLYPPQVEAIKKGLLEGNNMVIAIPTASGKTLLAMLACLQTLEIEGKKALYLSPLRALAYEKYLEFKRFFEPLGYRIVLLTGDYDTEDTKANIADVIIATNEKIDSALRHQARWTKKLGLVVSDEVHLINDSTRGPTLEVVLAQLKRITQAQIVALSATIKNADEIARWLQARLVVSEWRPVELKEGVLLGQIIKYKDGTTTNLPLHSRKPFDNLVRYILNNKQQVLVFCTTRNMAESTAKKLSRIVAKKITPEDVKVLQEAAESILRSGEITKQAKELAELVRKGISFHHAGLNTQQRRIIEETFKEGSIKVLTATPTLAAGVNLPARYVIIKSTYRYDITFGSRPIPVLEFKQQSGRAGRPQYDTRGDAILVAKTDYEAEELFNNYILADTENIESRIASEPALRRIVLGQIATGSTQTIEELLDFLSDTFYGYHSNPVNLVAIINEVINYLREQGLITKEPDYLIPTNFGKRVSELYIDPMSAVIIRDGLIEAQSKAKHFITDISILHLICSTPDVRFVTIRKKDFENFFNFINSHQEEFLLPLPVTPFELELFMSQLKTALIIKEWINETPEDLIIERYNIGSGDIHMIISNAEWILYATSEIAQLLGYTEISNKTKTLQQRVIHGIKEDLLELVKLPGIGRVRARRLYNYGIKTSEDIINTPYEELHKLPGIGHEILKNIYLYLLGREKTEEILGEIHFEKAKNKIKQQGQTTLEDFFE